MKISKSLKQQLNSHGVSLTVKCGMSCKNDQF
jgi:hypothetical protein